MIRRNFTFDDGTNAWLLVSQVEHARISGELTRAWSEPFSQEAIDGITHHDDGWKNWEAAPNMDPNRGRPLSFLELDVADAIRIWEGSIESARTFGPLAGAIVAGHFIGLARGSDHAARPPVQEWLAEWNATRDRWLADWLALSDANTVAEADRAQQMLYAADLFSLWLCLDGPVSDADESPEPNTEMQSRSTHILGSYRFAVESKVRSENRLDWRGSLTPWPLAVSELTLSTPARAVPIAKYPNWHAVAAASRGFELHWLLRQSLSDGGECR